MGTLGLTAGEPLFDPQGRPSCGQPTLGCEVQPRCGCFATSHWVSTAIVASGSLRFLAAQSTSRTARPVGSRDLDVVNGRRAREEKHVMRSHYFLRGSIRAAVRKVGNAP